MKFFLIFAVLGLVALIEAGKYQNNNNNGKPQTYLIECPENNNRVKRGVLSDPFGFKEYKNLIKLMDALQDCKISVFDPENPPQNNRFYISDSIF